MNLFFGTVLTYSVRRFIRKETFEITKNVIHRRYCNSVVSTNNSLVVDPNWGNDIEHLVDNENKSPLLPSNEDFSVFGKNKGHSFNLAPYANDSKVIQEMIKLGVDLHTVEKKYGAFYTILELDYEKHFKPHINFLCDYVDPSKLGAYITKHPMTFKDSIEDMQIRINYLISKKFNKNMISSIVSRNPYWLSFSTRRIDNRLGWFQTQFELTGNEIRKLAVNGPRLITYNLYHVEVNKFSMLEELGFEKAEWKHILLNHPKVYMMSNKKLVDKFNYIHLTMKIPHDVIAKLPRIFYCNTPRLRQRHTFLQKKGRDQYDFKNPNYVSLTDIGEGSDAEFCLNVAKCSITEYNAFLKSL